MAHSDAERKLFRRALAAAPVALAALAMWPGVARQEDRAMMTITSTAFAPGGAIPRKHTCDGADLSPPLAWSGVPATAKTLLLIVDDPDAPDPAAPKTTWVHWVLYNIPAGSSGLPEGVTPRDLPAGTREGLNDWKRTGYGGPCPPIGRHRYVHKLYALDMIVAQVGKATKAELEAALAGHVVAKAELVGTYRH